MGPRKKILQLIKLSMEVNPEVKSSSTGIETITTSQSENVQPRYEPDEPQTSGVSSMASYGNRFDVREWVNGHPKGKSLCRKFDSGAFAPKDRQLLVRILTSKLIEISETNYPPSHMKEKIAKQIIASFPCLKSTRGEGHESFYDIKTGAGFIAYRLKTIRTNLMPSKKKNAKTGVGKKIQSNFEAKMEIQFSLKDLEEKVNWMKLKLPTEANKPLVIKTLQETFTSRQAEIRNSDMSVTEILERYPHLKNYHGEMIDLEFRSMYPDGDKFLGKFSYFVQRVLPYVADEKHELLSAVEGYDDDLKCLLLLPELLPIPNYTKGKKENRTSKKSNKKMIPNPYLIKFVSVTH